MAISAAAGAVLPTFCRPLIRGNLGQKRANLGVKLRPEMRYSGHFEFEKGTIKYQKTVLGGAGGRKAANPWDVYLKQGQLRAVSRVP